jgi:hypothetical protein
VLPSPLTAQRMVATARGPRHAGAASTPAMSN